ncbi:phosphatidylserine decarboxylase [Streptomyces griseocarneus]|nr:phosphatidylserine decarboxylase [Streptomyces griseocarneus]
MGRDDAQYSGNIDEFIQKIQRWYENDHKGFKGAYDKAIAHVKPRPPHTDSDVWYDWTNATFEDLCNFFRKWYDWHPGVTDGLEYIEKFSWLTYDNKAGRKFVAHGPGYDMTVDFTHLQGKQMDDPMRSLSLIKKWIDQLGSKRMDDYKVAEWRTFNQFFIREIKEGRRPIAAQDDDSVVVAPADCVINMIVDELTEDTRIPVKTVSMNVKQLLNDSVYAKNFIGGRAVSCILMPDSYHWYHSPVAGEVVEANPGIGGLYYGFHSLPALLDDGDAGYGYDYREFDRFRRGYLVIKTVYPDAHGHPQETYVGMVPVGLNSIASVNFEEKFTNLKKPVRVEKGERIGNFKYGGSMNILLFEKDRFPALQMLQGQRIGTLEDPQRATKLFRRTHRAHPRSRGPLAL